MLVRALTYLGWTTIFAGWLVHIATTPARAAFFLGCELCPPGRLPEPELMFSHCPQT